MQPHKYMYTRACFKKHYEKLCVCVCVCVHVCVCMCCNMHLCYSCHKVYYELAWSEHCSDD